MRRVAGTDRLEGTIENNLWHGDETKSEPGVCAGALHIIVSMDAVGHVRDGQIEFGGVGQWRLDDVPCGHFSSGYALDNFAGPLDPARSEFQSMHNDGGAAVNQPTVFRRIACTQPSGGSEPKVVAKPPSFYPPAPQEPAGGCNAQ